MADDWILSPSAARRAAQVPDSPPPSTQDYRSGGERAPGGGTYFQTFQAPQPNVESTLAEDRHELEQFGVTFNIWRLVWQYWQLIDDYYHWVLGVDNAPGAAWEDVNAVNAGMQQLEQNLVTVFGPFQTPPQPTMPGQLQRALEEIEARVT